jgi:hypothetical protein
MTNVSQVQVHLNLKFKFKGLIVHLKPKAKYGKKLLARIFAQQ